MNEPNKYVAPEWSDLHEALARAWVLGWYAGRDGVKNDNGKREVAEELAKEFAHLLKK